MCCQPGQASHWSDSSLTLTNVMPVQAGNYSVVVTNDYGPSVTSSVVALTVTTIPLAEALDYANPGWTTYGNRLWFGQVGQTHDGVDAARSGAITNYQQSVLRKSTRLNSSHLG